METLTIEDLKNLIDAINSRIWFVDGDNLASLTRSKSIIEQMIKDLEFEQNKEL